MAVTLFAVNMGAPADKSDAETRARIKFSIENTLSIAVDQEISLNVSPQPGGTFKYETVPVSVSTNNITGYSLSFSMNGESNKLGSEESQDNGILALANDVEVTDTNKSAFTMNSWGYTTGNNLQGKSGDASKTVFSPVPLLSDAKQITVTDGPAAANTTDVTFAVHINPDLPVGIYNNTVLFTVVANTVPEVDNNKSIFNIFYMQDMTEQICTNTTTPLASATELDTTGEKAGNKNFVPSVELVDLRDGEQYTVRKLADGNCWMTQNLRLNVRTGLTLSPSDSDVVTDWSPQVLTSYPKDRRNYTDDPGAVDVAISYVDTTNKEHGGYYNWYTATAGTGTFYMPNDHHVATSSICPKGWQIPKGNKATHRSFKGLLTAYNSPLDIDSYGTTISQVFNFTLAGYANFDNPLLHVGEMGAWWTNMSSGDAFAHLQAATDTQVAYSDYGYYKAVGASVRCVARDGVPDNNSALTQALADDDADYEKDENGRSYYTMQSMKEEICKAVPTPTIDEKLVPEAILIDTRDRELYRVRKLADGNCWMTQNLRLQLSVDRPLSPADSDVVSDWTPEFNSETDTIVSWGSNFKEEDVNKARSFVNVTDKEYGGYYNWNAATAGTGVFAEQNASSSICPKGWGLPNGRTGSNSFANLIKTYYPNYVFGDFSSVPHNGAMFEPPFSLLLSGHYHTAGSINSVGTHAYWWSSTTFEDREAYRLGLMSDNVYPQNYNFKNQGYSIRCVANVKEPSNDTALTQALAEATAEYQKASDGKNYYTMQSMTEDICKAVSTPSKEETNVPEAIMIDARDGELYTVRKLADGNCWMTQDLRIIGEKLLTDFNSDVSAEWTLPVALKTSGFDDYYSASVAPANAALGNGAYYSWNAATAGDGSDFVIYSDALASVCPKGWRLPLNDGDKSYSNLITGIYGYSRASDLVARPMQFTYGGFYTDGSFKSGSESGSYWSTSAEDDYNAYHLYFNSTEVNTQKISERNLGFSVRCVAR